MGVEAIGRLAESDHDLRKLIQIVDIIAFQLIYYTVYSYLTLMMASCPRSSLPHIQPHNRSQDRSLFFSPVTHASNHRNTTSQLGLRRDAQRPGIRMEAYAAGRSIKSH